MKTPPYQLENGEPILHPEEFSGFPVDIISSSLPHVQVSLTQYQQNLKDHLNQFLWGIVQFIRFHCEPFFIAFGATEVWPSTLALPPNSFVKLDRLLHF